MNSTLPELPSRTVLTWLAAAFFIVSFTVYGGSLGNDFVRLDDDILIFENPLVRDQTLASFGKIFATYDPELYIPLTFLTYKLDAAIGGMQAFPFHVHNLVLHTLTALFVAWFLYLLSRRTGLALVCGLLFLVHPLHTEAVAWAAARKDVLSAPYFLGSIIAYIYAQDRSSRALLGASLLLFALGLMAKVSVITLPAILILIDLLHRPKISRAQIVNKVPYILIAILFGVIALFGKREMLTSLTFWETLLMICRSTAHYLQTFFLPIHLSPLYAYNDAVTLGRPVFLLSVAIVCLLAGAIVRYWTRWREMSFALAFVLVTLLPTFITFAKRDEVYIGSDRYAYIPSIGLFLAVSLLVSSWVDSRSTRRRRKAVQTSVGILAIILALMAGRQSRMWEKSETLFAHAVSVSPQSVIARNNLGNFYRRQGDSAKAEEQYRAALAIREHEETLLNLGAVERMKRQFDSAEAHYRRVLELDPTNADAVAGLGLLYAEQGRNDEALQFYAAAMEMNPRASLPYTNRGVLQEQMGDLDAAIADYRRAIELDPYSAQAYYNLGVALQTQGKEDEAISAYEQTVSLSPSFIPSRINLGILYAETARLEDATLQFEAVVSMDPANTAARSALEQIAAAMGRRR